MIIEFFVPGIPATAGSKRGIPIYRGKDERRQFTGHVAVVDSCKKKTTWMADVKHFAYQEFKETPLLGPLKMDVTFLMPRPKYHYRANGDLKETANVYNDKRPDRGKLLRAVEDALSGVIWKDDSQVCGGDVSKHYTCDQPGAKIRIVTL